MKLPELKKKVWALWTKLNSWKGELTSSPESFVAEMKRIGDRRYKQTWITALCRFEAMLSYEACLDSWALLTISFNFTPDRWDYEYRHQILDEFLMYPDGLEIIRTGLEQLYSNDYAEERENADGFFRLVAEREGRDRRIGVANGFARTAITGTRPAAAAG